jgi:hypothetical protein
MFNNLKISNMVTVVDYAVRQAKDGREFIALILQGGLSLVQSRSTGNTYATIKRVSIPSTFDEKTAKSFIGEKVPGTVQKKACEPYSFIVKDTGEILNMEYRWVYVPEGETLESAIYEGEPQVTLAERSPQRLIAAF